jgi:hypothetical protein
MKGSWLPMDPMDLDSCPGVGIAIAFVDRICIGGICS